MMTSSGSGAYRVGGSLSSSNLSPLAPPFKVDKSLSKQNSVNPSANFVDGPVYGSCFDPAPGQFWSPSSSSTSGPKCVVTESMVTITNCTSSPNMYRYHDTQSNTSQTGMYYGSGNGVTPFDPFAYDPIPNSMPSNANEAEKSYFVPYVPPPLKDGYLSLGVGSEPGYDFLSYSGSAHMCGDVPAQVDHAEAMPSDGGYKPKWGSIWSASGESEHDKWTDYVQGCASNDFNTLKFSSNRSPNFVDGSNKSQPFIDANVHPFVDGSNTQLFDDVNNQTHLKKGASLTQDVGLHGQDSTAKDNCFDIFGGARSLGCLGREQQSCKISDCSKMKTSAPVSNASASASASKGTPRLQEPVLVSISSICGAQKENVSSSEGHFREPGYFMFGCASNTSAFPKAFSELPYGGTISSMESTSPAIKRFSMGIDTSDHSNTTGGYNFSYQMDGQMPLGTKRHSSIRIRKPVSSAASSCQTGEIDNSRLDDKISFGKMKFSSQLPHQSSLDGLNMKDSDLEAVHSVEKHSAGSDGHNPAEDSPCWKGASSHRFSPFEHSESVDSDVLVRKIDSCKSLNSQDLPNRSNLSNAFGSKEFSSGKTNEATFLEKPPANDCIMKGNKDCGSSNLNFCRFDLNARDGFQFAEDCHASMVNCNMMNKSKANLSKAFISEECGNKTPVEKNFSGLKSNHGNNVSNLLPGNKASLKSAGEDSNSRIDINALLRTMMNLSETFRCYGFRNRTEVSEKQTLAVKQILCNLNSSMLLMSGQTTATSTLSSPDKLILKEFPVLQVVNDAEVLATSLKLGGTNEDFSDYISSTDDEHSFADANMCEAVRKLISEDFQEEEIDQQKLLYKNLWLEAEASLCAMTAKARFLHMKTQMKSTRDGVKDKDKPTRSNVDADLHKDIKLPNDNSHPPSFGEYSDPTKTNDIKVYHDPKSQEGQVDFSESESSISTKNKPIFPSLYASSNKENSCSTSHGKDDDETCVMARYQILKNCVGCLDSLNYESNLPSGEQKCPSSEFDVGNTSPASGTTFKANDPEIFAHGGYQILKGQDENAGCPSYEGQQSPGDENYLPDNDFLNDTALQDSQMSNSLGVTTDNEASVMARFRLIQSRKDHLNSLNSDSVLAQASAVLVEDGTDDMGGDEKDNVKKTSFGPYPQLTEDDDINNSEIVTTEQAFDPIMKTNGMNSVIFEGWYDNDCSSSDWEHISSRDV